MIRATEVTVGRLGYTSHPRHRRHRIPLSRCSPVVMVKPTEISSHDSLACNIELAAMSQRLTEDDVSCSVR